MPHPDSFFKGIREDNTVDGYPVETHYLPCSSVADDDGFVRVVVEADGYDIETRVAHSTLIAAGWVKATSGVPGTPAKLCKHCEMTGDKCDGGCGTAGVAPVEAPSFPEYGSTDSGFAIAGVQTTDGDKRLMALLVSALGSDHPAVTDLVALLFRAGPAGVKGPEHG